MRHLLDTNTCVALLRDTSARIGREFERVVARDGRIGVSSWVVSELWYGVYRSSRVQENTDTLLKFLRGPVEVLAFDNNDARAAGALRAELARKGKSLGSYDTLIAGQCLSRNLIVVTSNVAEFQRVQGLRWEDWLDAAE